MIMTRSLSTLPGALRLVLATLAFLFVSCAGVRVRGDSDLVLPSASRYVLLAPPADGRELPYGELYDSLRAALAQRGFEEVQRSAADVLIEPRMNVSLETRELQPFYDFEVAERYESLLLSITFKVADGRAWTGEVEHRLRGVARATGGVINARWNPTEEERSWEFTKSVRRILDQLPVASGS